MVRPAARPRILSGPTDQAVTKFKAVYAKKYCLSSTSLCINSLSLRDWYVLCLVGTRNARTIPAQFDYKRNGGKVSSGYGGAVRI
jgi:hypothetical protein